VVSVVTQPLKTSTHMMVIIGVIGRRSRWFRIWHSMRLGVFSTLSGYA
jgi:hypothetical protein